MVPVELGVGLVLAWTFFGPDPVLVSDITITRDFVNCLSFSVTSVHELSDFPPMTHTHPLLLRIGKTCLRLHLKFTRLGGDKLSIIITKFIISILFQFQY